MPFGSSESWLVRLGYLSFVWAWTTFEQAKQSEPFYARTRKQQAVNAASPVAEQERTLT